MDPDQLFLRPTVIASDRLENDYQIIWRDLPVGRIDPATARHSLRTAELVMGRGLPGSTAAAGAPGIVQRRRGMQATGQGGLERDQAWADFW